MFTRLSEVQLPLVDENGTQKALVRIVARGNSNNNSLIEIDQSECRTWCESPIQLMEGHIYDYELKLNHVDWRMRPGIARKGSLSDKLTERGTIEPQSYTGLLPLILEDAAGVRIADAAVEVRSSKVDYRHDYRQMLDFVADKSTDLVLDLRAPSLAPIDASALSSATIAQRFSLVKHLFTGRVFRDALTRITTLPHERSCIAPQSRSTSQGFRSGYGIQKQLASSYPRLELPANHPLRGTLPSVPLRITVSRPTVSLDTPENRFVKFVLNAFESFLADLERRLRALNQQNDRGLCAEIVSTREEITSVLSRSMFREIRDATMLPMGSPVLQRRSGYREVLRAWLRFNLAAVLQWRGGDDVYGSGKRDVALLYEYWLFFQFIELLKRKFRFSSKSLSQLVETTTNGFGLKLRAGNFIPIDGEWSVGGDTYHVRFSFNRTFMRIANPDGDPERSYPSPGSWTRRLRPDYTLTIWPAKLSESEAESAEKIAHLHFDAKYRAKRPADLFGPELEGGLDSNEQRTEIDLKPHRSDLLKMHAYRDAIRRTVSAVVLYPGDETVVWRKGKGKIPALGAIPVTPSAPDCMQAVSRFLDEALSDVVRSLGATA